MGQNQYQKEHFLFISKAKNLISVRRVQRTSVYNVQDSREFLADETLRRRNYIDQNKARKVQRNKKPEWLILLAETILLLLRKSRKMVVVYSLQ